MSYLFDSSAIFKAVRENTVEILVGGYTLELARYELGNVLWKECSLREKISSGELKKLAKIIKETLNLLEILEVSCHEEEILDLAGRLRLTFYDATYAYFARKKKLLLITEDLTLLSKVKPYIKVSKLDDVV
jgi:predicted nucleic acid-binding protein